MAINYYDIFRKRTGQFDAATPPSDAIVISWLDEASVKYSRTYATPWGEFSDVPNDYKWPIVLLAAIEYWWNKAAMFVDKTDVRGGSGGIGKSANTMFDRALRMIGEIQDELDSLKVGAEGSGDVIVGDLVIRSKHSGYLIPREDDPNGNWLS